MSATQVTAGGITPSYGYFKCTPDRILVTPPLVGRQDILTWKEAIEPHLEMVGLISFARGTVATPDDPDLHAEFRAVQLLTFTVISRCCSPGVQIALKWCLEYLDAGHQAWHFIESTYQVIDDLFIAQLEGQLTHLRMGDEEMATDYCNRARRILATIRMAGAQYSTASYVTHVMQGLSSSYNLLKRLSMALSTRATLNEDNLTSYILQDEAMQEAERSQELLAQAYFVAPAMTRGRPGQRGQSGGGGSSGWKPAKEVDKKNSTKDSGQGGGSQRRECWLCGDHDHLSFECPDRTDSDDDDAKGGHGRCGSRRPRRGGNKPHKEKQSTMSTSAMDADSLAGEVQASPAVVLLDSGCFHHLMGMREVFVNLHTSGDIKHVRGFNGALQDVQGCGTVALQGEAGKQVLIPNVLYIPGVRANLLSAGQLRENGVKLQEDGDAMLLASAAGEVLSQAMYYGRVLCTDLRPCSTRSTSPTPEVVALWAIVSMTKLTPDKMYARLAHVGMDTIRSSAKHKVATGLELKSAAGVHSPCVLCVSEKLAWHTFPDQGSDADDVLVVVHIDLCGPFRVAAKEGSLYFLLLKNRKTRYVWVRPVAKKSDVLLQIEKWLVLRRRQGDRPRPDLPVDPSAERHGGAGDADGGGVGADNAVAHGRAAPLVAPRFGCELLDIADNRVVTTSDVVFYEDMSLEVWNSEHRPVSGRTPTTPTSDFSTPRSVEEEQPTWVKPTKKTPVGQQPTGEQAVVSPTTEQSATRQSAEEPTIGERSASKSTEVQQDDEGSKVGDEGEKSTDSVVVEVRPQPRKSGRLRRPPDFFVPAASTTMYDVDDNDLVYDNAEEDEEFLELDPDLHADPEHHPQPHQHEYLGAGRAPTRVNIMKNRWVLTTKHHVDDTVEREKARLVVKGFTQVYGADYDETFTPVGGYVTLRIFLSIVAVLNLNLM
ncbi:unnamed protein product [Closterium sp. NIES-64]|nr:unnamed protein product [Closterium sp. NIES-64]